MVKRYDFGARDADGSTPLYVRASDYDALAAAFKRETDRMFEVREENDRLNDHIRELEAVQDDWCAEYVKVRDLLQRAHRWVIGRDDVLDDAIRASRAGSAPSDATVDRGGKPE